MNGMPRGDHWTLGRRPALDGLRGVAVLIVVASHFLVGLVRLRGAVGVEVFFTLSGFLITTLLLEEHASTGAVWLRRFYVRRARRLFPALLALVVVVVGLTVVGLPTMVGAGVALSSMFYVTNWYIVAVPEVTALYHTWSLSVEEQFYLVWPFVVIAAIRWGVRGVRWAAVGGSAVALALWGALGEPWSALVMPAWPVLAGCALAAFMHRRPLHAASRAVASAAVGLVVLLFLLSPALPVNLVDAVVPVLAVAAVWAAAQVRVGWLESRVLGWCGTRSYSLYLWHFPIAFMLPVQRFGWGLAVVGGLALSLALAEVSFRWIESPFRARRVAIAPVSVSA